MTTAKSISSTFCVYTSREISCFSYLGPVFSLPRRPGERIPQAGVESFGRPDRAAADAEMLALALEATAAVGLSEIEIRTGDVALFTALIDALKLDPVWRRGCSRISTARSTSPRTSNRSRSQPDPAILQRGVSPLLVSRPAPLDELDSGQAQEQDEAGSEIASPR